VHYSLVLFISCMACCASAAEDIAPSSSFKVDPWRLGMTREEVMSFTEFGPYAHVPITGGVETSNAHFQDKATNVSFVFDDAGVQYIQVWKYEGKDFPSAKGAVLELFDLFETRGGVEIPGVDISGPAGLDRAAMTVVLDRILGTARDLGNDAKKKYKATMLIMFDMLPKTQPDGSRLHSQWGYSSRHDTFYVFLFQDRPYAPSRRVSSNVQLEKL
jgi:hypothetical protein